MTRLIRLLIIVAALFIALITAGCVLQRKLLFFPSHRPDTNGLVAWTIDGRLIGYARKVEHPQNVWLFTHGNAGQASDRTYALPSFSASDSVFILEYPGYGERPGTPSKASIDAAAEEAYLWLRKEYPKLPVCVAGESIGSGPASHLATLAKQPDKVVLIVPFDNLASVVKDHLPLIPASLVLFDRWDNVQALKGYAGKVEIFAASNDRVIPVYHARALAKALPHAVLHEIPAGHNDWSQYGLVRIRN
jgi:pimeloyl-ACP methyl ester carboxylesterase